MSRNQWTVLTLLALAVAVVCGTLGAVALLYATASLPAQTGAPVEPADTATSHPASTLTTPRVSICQSQTQDYLAEIYPLLEDWDDTLQVADSTARIALSPVVQDMQAIRRDIADVPVPDCARHGRALLVDGMETLIDAFLDFMADEPDYILRPKFDRGYDQLLAGLEELAALAQGRK